MIKKKLTFIDLFAGAGGLSEGFIRAGFEPFAHVEIDEAACNTLKTRMARHSLYNSGKPEKIELYKQYLHGNISRNTLWNSVPQKVIDSVIHQRIGKQTNPVIFDKIDTIIGDNHVDLIIGGPPCQAYSLAGRSRDKNGMKGDARNYLYKYYAEFLEKYKPKYFVFENVLGLLSAKDENKKSYFNKMRTLFKKTGYETDWRILNTADFGIPQQRKRLILIGQYQAVPTYPMPATIEVPLTINQLFADLPIISAGGGQISPQKYIKKANPYLQEIGLRDGANDVTWQISRPNNAQDLEIYKVAVEMWNTKGKRLNYNNLHEELKTHKNRETHIDRFKVVLGESNHAHTVVAHIAKDGHYYIHPDINQNRSLTPREVARIQTFPDDYYFEGISEKPSRTAAFKQIGNAVPVLLGEKIAFKMKEVW